MNSISTATTATSSSATKSPTASAPSAGAPKGMPSKDTGGIFYRLPSRGETTSRRSPYEPDKVLVLNILVDFALRYCVMTGESLPAPLAEALGIERWNCGLDFGHPLEELYELRGLRFILRDGCPLMYLLCHDGRVVDPLTMDSDALSRILGEVMRTSAMTSRQKALYSPGLDSLYVNPLVGRVQQSTKGFYLVLLKGASPLMVNSLGQPLRTPLSLFSRLHEFRCLGTYQGRVYFGARGEVLLSACPSPEKVDSVLFDLNGHPCEFVTPSLNEYRSLSDMQGIFDRIVEHEGEDLPSVGGALIRRADAPGMTAR